MEINVLELVGDVKINETNMVLRESFLKELKEMMLRYEVYKVDVCWALDFNNGEIEP